MTLFDSVLTGGIYDFLETDGEYLYFSRVDYLGAFLERKHKCGGPRIELMHLPEDTRATALAVDETYVYWAQRGLVSSQDDGLYRAAK